MFYVYILGKGSNVVYVVIVIVILVLCLLDVAITVNTIARRLTNYLVAIVIVNTAILNGMGNNNESIYIVCMLQLFYV